MPEPQKKKEQQQNAPQEGQTQSGGITGKLLEALRLAVTPGEKFKLEDQLAHITSTEGKTNEFENAENKDIFSAGTLVKLCLFAAAMLMGTKLSGGKTSQLDSLAQEVKAAEMGKQKFSLTDAKNMLHSMENSSLAQSIVKRVRAVTSTAKKYIPEHCGDWAQYVYRTSGAKAKMVWPSREELKLANGRSKQIHALRRGNYPEGENEALELVQPGDWIYYYNKNPFGKGTDWEGQHSSIFLGWIDKNRRIAKTASGSAGVPGREQKINLAKNPITRIHKPQVA